LRPRILAPGEDVLESAQCRDLVAGSAGGGQTDRMGTTSSRLVLLAALALAPLCPTPSQAVGTGVREEPQVEALGSGGRPNEAASGDFAVLQIATTDPAGLLADWARPGAGARLQAFTRTVRHRPIVTYLVFKGCRADAAGACNVTASFETLDPGGRSVGPASAAKVWVGRPPAPGLALQLSQDGYGLEFNDSDPAGAYRVRVSITDHIAGITVQTEQQLTLGSD
jgi:hypothetical protein